MRTIQAEHEAWVRERFPQATAEDCLLKLVEEVGELVKAHNREAWHDGELEPTRDAVGDVVVSLMGYCSLRGWDIEVETEGVWLDVKRRKFGPLSKTTI